MNQQQAKRILISGASGLVGGALQVVLREQGHEVFALKRSAAQEGVATWDPSRGEIDLSAIGQVDAVIHLAGDNISAGRWTASKKASIVDSRVQGTRLLAQHFAACKNKPQVMISASAIGIYGDRGPELIDEQSTLGEGFLANVCQQWEASTAIAEQAGIRVVHARIGVILDRNGGALSKLLPPFRFGAGGRLGSGQQWMSWISLADVVASIQFLLDTAQLKGAINLVAPHAVTNQQLTRSLASALHRPAFMPLPAAIVRLLFGEMGQELLLAGVHVQPTALQKAGYSFRHPRLEGLLAEQLS
ncbi:MAG: TIGR01777 family protein [Planctomycetes bacterium]|nr:TIGR01777 family protein [Planctomycetota bacterium]MCP4859967.1 TIGR01777 family protein [Planctomycetota bacterium]